MTTEQDEAPIGSHLHEQEQGEQEPSRIKWIVRDAKWALTPSPPIEWIVENLIPENSLSMFYGKEGAKKTFSMLSLSVCIALGKQWLGFSTTQQKVLYINEETSEKLFKPRFEKSILGEFGDENIPLECVSLTGMLLDDRSMVEEFSARIAESGAKLCILDALNRFMIGDENSKKDVQPVFTNLQRVTEQTDCSFIVIHHSGKSGDYRGSSAMGGAVDLLIKMISEEGSEWIDFRVQKARYSDAIKWAATAHWSDDQFYLTGAERAMPDKQLNLSDKYVLRYLEQNGASLLSNITGAADSCSPAAAKKAVYRLVDSGHIYRTNPEDVGRGSVAEYELTNQQKRSKYYSTD